jgi:hypothetical protein
MTEEEFLMLWTMITSLARQAQLIPVEKVRMLIDTAHRADTIMPVLDPTVWRANRHHLDDQVTLAEGFLAFRKAIDNVKENAT